MHRALPVALACAATLGAQGGQPGWVPPLTPRPTSGLGMVYDEARQRLAIYGGEKPCASPCHNVHRELWEWAGSSWVLRRTPKSPVDGDGDGLVYDSARQRIVFFSGRLWTSAPTATETWEWDGLAWSQRPTRVSPSIRGGHAVAYDSARDRVVLFGGYTSVSSSGRDLSDTWEWDGKTWAQRQPAQSPPARGDHDMVYDRARGKVVMYGGLDSSPRRTLGDTWEWDGTTWTQRTPAVSPPSLDSHSMAYDTARQRVVLFGGVHRPSILVRTAMYDTWEWDGTTWALRSQGTGPTVEGEHGMAYDEAAGRTVLFGGTSTSKVSGDTWEWDGTTWALRASPQVEPQVTTAVLMYDGVRRRTLLHASQGMWEFDGTGWQQLFPARSPSPRSLFALVWDSGRQRGVLFGGADFSGVRKDTWEWDGITWSRQRPDNIPGGRGGHGMAYDAGRARVVMFGGATTTPGGQFPKGDTWEWNGTDWLRRNPTVSPSPRAHAAMTWDPVSGRTILFGGVSRSTAHADTWEWDGTSWTQLLPVDSPRQRARAAMTWDPVRGRVVLFGGHEPSPFGYFYSALRHYDDTWEWDGTNWTQTMPQGPRPAPREHAGMAFDQTLQRTILFGGIGPYAIGAFAEPTRVHGTWMYTTKLAASLTYGAGCAGSAGTPRLGTFGAAALGRPDFALELAAARPQAAAVVLLGTAATSLTLSGDCALLVDLTSPWTTLPGLTNAAGTASFPLPLPTDPSLIGQTLWSQAAIFDPAGVWQGLAFSGGLAVTLGY